jgi:ubiquinone biosynthesis protein COQ9
LGNQPRFWIWKFFPSASQSIIGVAFSALLCLLATGVAGRLSNQIIMRVRILQGALAEVPIHGWSRKSLEVSASKLGLSRAAHGVVSGGETDLVEFFIQQCNTNLGGSVGPIGELTMRDRLRVVCKARVQMVLAFESTWKEALAVLAAPYNVPRAARLMGETADEILHVW